MTEDDRKDAAKIKRQLRLLFGIGIFACGIIKPGEMVDVILEEMRTLLTIVVAPGDEVNGMAACVLISRLPASVRDQVLLQCGNTLDIKQVLNCAKQLMDFGSCLVGASAAAFQHLALSA